MKYLSALLHQSACAYCYIKDERKHNLLMHKCKQFVLPKCII